MPGLLRFFSRCGACCAVACFYTAPAGATYSVLVHDGVTGEFGAGAVSCVGAFDLSRIFGFAASSPLRADAFAFFAQALYSEQNHEQILAWGSEGRTPRQILDQLTRGEFDPLAAERQYHFLSSSGEPLTWTGGETLPHAEAQAGEWGQLSFTVAGNILTSSAVLSNVQQSLRSSSGSVEDRVLAALEAGAQNGEGDSRCGDLPGDSAFLTVLTAAGDVRLTRSAVDTQPQDPLTRLRETLSTAPVGSPTSAQPTGRDTAPDDQNAAPTVRRSGNPGCDFGRGVATSPRWPLVLLLGALGWVRSRSGAVCGQWLA